MSSSECNPRGLKRNRIEIYNITDFNKIILLVFRKSCKNISFTLKFYILLYSLTYCCSCILTYLVFILFLSFEIKKFIKSQGQEKRKNRIEKRK